MADVFISYKREDKQVAERLSIALEQLGFDVWWDLNLISGQPYRSAIRAVIDQCKAAIVLWSEKSVQSEFVMDEASYAHRLGKLCPARIDGVELPMGFGQTHTADLLGWDGETNHRGFQNIVSAIEARVGRKGKLGSSTRTAEVEAAAAELEAFKTAQYAGTPQALKAFLKHFPRGMFASFVRGQLESMEVDAPHAAAVDGRAEAAVLREPPRPAPAYEPSLNPPPLTHSSEPGKKSPLWALIAVGALALVAVVLVVSTRPREKNSPEPQQAESTSPARDVAAEIEAARRDGRERAEAEFAERDRRSRDSRPPPITATRPDPVPTVTAEPIGYDLAQLHPDVRRAAERAREAERVGVAASSRARIAAADAETAARRAREREDGHSVRIWDDGDRYEGRFSNGARSGFGIYLHGDPQYLGDRYAGGFSNNAFSGVGIYTYARNPGNATNSARYEGEYSNNNCIMGVYFWHDGDRYAGQLQGCASKAGDGVYYWAEGRRYEGEWSGDQRNGLGVLWDPQGRIIQQGRWTNSTLTTPLTR